MYGVAEVELLCERHETVGALFDDPAAGDHVEACCGDFHGIAANFGKRAQIVFEGGQFAIIRAGVEAGTYKIAHFVISRARKVMGVRTPHMRRHFKQVRAADIDVVYPGRCDVVRKSEAAVSVKSDRDMVIRFR
ncbi:hypothetical protein L907_13060 [Agrobacterium sp. C13]|nr:hypothetical protein L903_13140 [Agrobacterium sp. JL28]KVK55131.1 hypothetical protein L906_13090 [Agrobacterium sp. TS45]KVK57679.1 hypothetical protein L907_13060 [Agrobacterium sp. C13]